MLLNSDNVEGPLPQGVTEWLCDASHRMAGVLREEQGKWGVLNDCRNLSQVFRNFGLTGSSENQTRWGMGNASFSSCSANLRHHK